MIAKCTCPHCGQDIEFDAVDTGRICDCPTCKKAIELRTPIPASEIAVSDYIQKNLMPGEAVIASARLHWAIFIPSIFSTLIIIGILIVIPFFGVGIGIAAIWFLISLVCWTVPTLLIAVIRKKTSDFVVTNKRVLMKFGFIRRASIEIVLAKVESIIVVQDILGRILDYGTIIVGGTGGTKDPFPKITRPLQFRQTIQKQIEADRK
jgi:hypothetical protein